MTREQITRGWKPAGPGAQTVDDFVEVAAESAPAPAFDQDDDQQRESIERRLENWGRFVRLESRPDVSPTAVYCERLRKEAMGELAGGAAVRDPVNEADALLVERAMREIPGDKRKLLKICYVDRERPEVVCRVLRIPHRPIEIFKQRLRDAQAAIEKLV